MMSSLSSSPMERRTTSGPAPAFRRRARSPGRSTHTMTESSTTFLVVVGLLVWYFGFQRLAGRVPDVESEPNNEPAQANRLASGKAVRGQIGKRLNREQSDRDFSLRSTQ